jgi:LysM repeat protein
MTPPGNSYPVIVPDGAAQAHAAATPAADEPNTHRVAQGESLALIAARHGVSVTALQRVNGLGTRATIRPGQVLRLPV